jgi:hypothetical protein
MEIELLPPIPAHSVEDEQLEKLKQAMASFPDFLGRPALPPVTGEIDAGLVRHRRNHDPIYLHAVRRTLMILAPRRLWSEPQKIRASNVVMLPNFAPAHPAKRPLGVVRMRLRFILKTVGIVVVDPMQGKPDC